MIDPPRSPRPPAPNLSQVCALLPAAPQSQPTQIRPVAWSDLEYGMQMLTVAPDGEYDSSNHTVSMYKPVNGPSITNDGRVMSLRVVCTAADSHRILASNSSSSQDMPRRSDDPQWTIAVIDAVRSATPQHRRPAAVVR
ncbi:hypothetical protein C8Q79DRAFT_211379 [Trametes meyenii]|nr:hypothetical protein C8Q79DRAFT_211379 [Trametes meyenii]